MGVEIWKAALSDSRTILAVSLTFERGSSPMEYGARSMEHQSKSNVLIGVRGMVKSSLPANMRHGTKWFSSALTMAFLAIIALFVSPALAWSCCCNSQPPTASIVASQKVQSRLAPMPSHCVRPCCAHEDEAMTSVGAASSRWAGHVTTIKAKCHCSHDADIPTATSVSPYSFSAPVALAMPLRAVVFSYAEDARTLPCFAVAARPRSPGRRSSCGRGPPIFSS